MPEQRYEVLNEKRTSPPSSMKGFFCDRMIVNYTSVPIAVVDIYGTHHIVQPVSAVASANGIIELVYRSTDVPRTDPTQRYATVEQPIAATRIDLNSSQLELGPVYVEEMEVVVCKPEQLPAVIHPKSKSAYDTAVQLASVTLAKNELFPSLRLFANDPSGLITELYAYMFGVVVCCPVTNLSNREATISVTITSGNQLVYQKTYSMGEYYNKNKFLRDDESPVICIGASRVMVEQYARNHERDARKVSDDDMKILQAEAEYNAAKKYEQVIRDLGAKLDQSRWEAQQLTMKNQTLQTKLADSENQVAVYTSQINGYNAIFKSREQLDVLSRSSMQTDIIREKTRQARIATDTEKIKQSEIVWKVVGGAVIAITTALVTSWLKDKK